MVGLTDISLSGTVTSCKLQMYSHYAYCLAAAVLTCFIINVTRTLLTMTVYLGPRFDKIFLIIAGMPYVQRRSFNLGQQGGRSFSLGQQGSMTHSHGHFRHLLGITSSISVASVLLKQKQKNILEHERILCFNKQTKKNMQGSQEIFNPRFTLFLLALLTELSLPCRNALCSLETPCGCCIIHKCTDYIIYII